MIFSATAAVVVIDFSSTVQLPYSTLFIHLFVHLNFHLDDLPFKFKFKSRRTLQKFKFEENIFAKQLNVIVLSIDTVQISIIKPAR